MIVFAYIDPGSGSYLYQLAIAGITAFIFFFGNMKRGLKKWLQSLRNKFTHRD